MAVVAIVALALWVGRLLSLSAVYRDRARNYEEGHLGSTNIIGGPRERYMIVRPPSPHLLWRRKMAEKYWQASWCPWLPVAPDPAEPGGSGANGSRKEMLLRHIVWAD
jgi:hypothetical protein